MAAIGMGGCDKGFFGSDAEEPVMYGVPWASYAVKGAVVDKVTQRPIEGIEVKIVVPDSLGIATEKGWADTTNVKGEFKLAATPGFFCPLIITDIDGSANGVFHPDTVSLDDKATELIGNNGGWFQGELTVTVTVELEPATKGE
jgi:putative lipoprotein (rSAM/lipoprotein system)